MPNYVDLGYRRWTIRYDAGCTDDEYGETVANKGRILIQEGQDGPAEVDTVIHELLHAMLHNVDTPLSTKQEETTVTQLAHGLVELIQRNPHLLRWFELRLKEDTT